MIGTQLFDLPLTVAAVDVLRVSLVNWLIYRVIPDSSGVRGAPSDPVFKVLRSELLESTCGVCLDDETISLMQTLNDGYRHQMHPQKVLYVVTYLLPHVIAVASSTSRAAEDHSQS